MIHQEKVKTMSRLALYEKKRGKRDLKIYSYDERDYIRFQGLKTAVFVTIAFVLLAGLFAIANIETFVDRFDTLNYTMVFAAAAVVYLLFLGFYLFISLRQSRRELAEVKRWIRFYTDELKKMEDFYEEEEQQQKKFEKGQWQNG